MLSPFCRRALIALGISVAVTLCHAAAQFTAWAYTAGNTASAQPASSLAQKSWAVISGPLFWVVGAETATESFWFVFLLNSVIWGACAACCGLFLTRGR